MFQVDWAQTEIWKNEQPLSAAANPQRGKEGVRRTALLHWEEHCLECAIPTCYTSCALYVERADGKCSRFSYGIYPNPTIRGLFDFGADIRFRRWGKLETRLYGKSVSVVQHRLLDRINRTITRPLEGASAGNNPSDRQPVPGRRTGVFGKSLFGKLRNKYLVKFPAAAEDVPFDEFVMECFSPADKPFRLILEYFDREVKARHAFDIKPGWNSHSLPCEAFKFASVPPAGKLTLYPEDNAEVRLIFTWLDLVQYREARSRQSSQTKRPVPAAKVKCVAWDLDNTMWRGILAEDTEAKLTPRHEALDLIRKLDERGILQTVVSKNNFADAWPVIERLGLQDYFLHPAINWQPKSSNLKEIASQLNLNVDAFAFIDDSAFERAEVQATLPQVRVYSEDQIENLLTYGEFDVRVSESSRKRRASYLTEIRREKEREASGGDYETFLRSCQMKLRLFVPREERHIVRCLELIQRANQLNLSNSRYTADEFQSLLSRPGVLCVAMDCEDRFGAYGIVGFVSVDETGDKPTVRDLVLSCRVAQKKVEHTFVEWLAARERARDKKWLGAAIVRTERNQAILKVFEDLRFQTAGTKEGFAELMELPLDAVVSAGGVVTVEADSDLWPAGQWTHGVH